MWGATGIVICLLLASGAFLATIDREPQSVSILARVNDEGSGIFIKSDRPDLDIHSPEGWEGLTFMTPGPSSIQHMILNDIVTSPEIGMKFVQQGMQSEGKTVYWTQVAPGLMTDTMFEVNKDIDGGIAWEPHYSVALDYKKGSDSCKAVASTKEYKPDHPCCVIAANNDFLNANEDAVKRFLAGYVKSVQWINDTLEAGEGEDFDYLLEKTIDIGTPKTSDESKQMSKTTALNALENIRFTYSLANENVDLASQLEEVIETYKRLKIVQEEVLTNAGFETSADFTNHLVQGTYLDDIFENGNLKTPEELGYDGGGETTINVAYLAADIHQMALHIGIGKGFYEDYGIHVRLNGPYGAGGDVMNALLSKHSNLGFVGSPPVVSSSINALRS